jgi:hypothetical protein
MCDDCKKSIGKMKKKKKAKINGLDTNGMIEVAKKAGLGVLGYALGSYTNKMIEDGTKDKTKVPNAGLVGAGKCIVSVLVPTLYKNEMVEDAMIGLFISGAKDIIVANAAEVAGQIGLHGISYPDYYMPDYAQATGAGYSGGYNASGAVSKVAM